MRNKLILSILLVLSLCRSSFSQSNQTESLTITTYFPAPYGVYKNLRLLPSEQPTAASAQQPGNMYFNGTNNKLYVYNSITNKWEAVSGESFWVKNLNNITTANSTWNVGIGISSPSNKLEVAGRVNATVDVCITGGKCLSGCVLPAGGCGPSANVVFSSAPTTGPGLCSSGTPSAVTAVSPTGPWTWTCTGATIASCSTACGLYQCKHTQAQCTAIPGAYVRMEGTIALCVVHASSCPGDWTWLPNYCATAHSCCWGGYNVDYTQAICWWWSEPGPQGKCDMSTGETWTPDHSFGNVAPETCQYIWSSMGFATCHSAITDVGCY